MAERRGFDGRVLNSVQSHNGFSVVDDFYPDQLKKVDLKGNGLERMGLLS